MRDRMGNIQIGDVILKINEHSIRETKDVISAIKSLSPNDEIAITINRGKKIFKVYTVLREKQVHWMARL